METTTPFDLNQAIQRWRENLGQSPAFRSENLFELEAHLRDSVSTLQRQGLSEEESLIVAIKRIGPNATIEAEFSKQNTRSVWLDRALWIMIGAQVWGFMGSASQYLQFITNVCLPKVNEWLATYGFGHISETIAAQACYGIGFPVTLLFCVKAGMILHRLAERRGWEPVSFMLNRPRALACVFLVLCLLPMALNVGVAFLASPSGLERTFRSPGMSPNAALAMFVLQTLAFTALVMIIARRRLRLCRS